MCVCVCSAPTTSARDGSETYACSTRAYVLTQARVRACERASCRHTRVERSSRGRERGRLGSSTWLARERAVLGSGVSQPETEGERARETGRGNARKNIRENSFVRSFVHSRLVGSER